MARHTERSSAVRPRKNLNPYFGGGVNCPPVLSGRSQALPRSCPPTHQQRVACLNSARRYREACKGWSRASPPLRRPPQFPRPGLGRLRFVGKEMAARRFGIGLRRAIEVSGGIEPPLSGLTLSRSSNRDAPEGPAQERRHHAEIKYSGGEWNKAHND